MHRTRLFQIILASAAAFAAAPLLGNPGSGGGSVPPSASAPNFDPAAEYRAGIEALKEQRFGDAKKAFARVLRVAPKDANTNYLAGLAEAGLDDHKAARRHFERAVKADESLIGARQELAVAYVRLGDRAKAEAELAKLRAKAQGCGETCAEAAQLKAAVEAVETALAGAPQARSDTAAGLLFASAASGDRAYLDAVALINERRFDEAVERLQAAQASFGPHPDILTYLGFAHRKLGRLATAEDYYRQALAAAPEHKGATEYYGELMIERGDLPGARRMLARLESLCDFGCAEADELRRWLEAGRSPAS